jgi:hypothetical protein
MSNNEQESLATKSKVRVKRDFRGIPKLILKCPKLKFPVNPNDIFISCDLRDCVLDGLDLSGVEFYGCRLNGTSFRGANLQGVKFIGCFASEQGAPMDLRECFWQETQVIDSHLCYLSEEIAQISLSKQSPEFWYWQPEVASAAWDSLSENSNLKYKAAEQLGNLGSSFVAPLLIYLLDDREWGVRLATLKALGELRQEQFPYLDQQLMEWMFYCLGDDNHLVRQETVAQ